MCKDLGTLSQGHKVLVEGTNTFFFVSHDKIRDKPPDKTVTYVRIFVDYQPQKSDSNRVRLMVVGNIINVPGDPSTTASHLAISKILWNIVLSTKYTHFACIDIKKIYLQNPMTDYE